MAKLGASLHLAACPSPHHVRAPHRCRRSLVIRARTQGETASYVPPSYVGSATELTALQRFSEVVPDVLLSQTLQDVEAPKAATASRSVLGGIVASPSAPSRYKIAIEQAKYYDKCTTLAGGDKTACQIDKALVNLGALFLEKVEGRVSTEVDPKVARDADKLIARGRNLIAMYEEVGVPRSRVLLRIPATWEGIQAAKQLESEGITTHLVLVYSFVQGAAAAQGGVSVIQPNVGRLHDWYNRHPGYIRDPKGPLEESYYGKQSDINPGVLLVQRLYNYVKCHHPKTLIMASGIRTKQEALALSGCDYLVIGPRVLEELGRNTTLEGYNDGLSATTGSEEALEPRLSKISAKDCEFLPDELSPVTEKSYKQDLTLAASELVDEGLKRLVEDSNRLEPYFLGLAGGQT